MAGHSKWANIKRQKARVDAVKGKTFTQLSRAIIVAARNGIPDPNGNFQLRTAIDKAKAAGIPNDNIDRAIAKGAGTWENDGNSLESIRYEGYGPSGVAIIIEALTDNRNRTAADLRAAFNKRGGNLGETGCVSWLFQHKGVSILSGEIDEEKLLEASLLADADSYELIDNPEEPGAEIITSTHNLDNLNQILQQLGFQITDSQWRWIPDNWVEINDPEQEQQLVKLIDSLEVLDDVQNVTTNWASSTTA